MEILINILILVFEIMYYSLFIKFTKKDGKFLKYILLFIFITIFIGILGVNQLISYLSFIILTLIGLKYFIKAKIRIIDLTLISLILITKVIIEFGCIILLYNILKFDELFTTIVYQILKILIIIILKDKLNLIYNLVCKKWDNENFNIRWGSSILIIIYVIISLIFLMFF